MNETETIVNESTNQGNRFKRKFRASKLLLIPYIIFCGVLFSNVLYIIETTRWVGDSLEDIICSFLFDKMNMEIYHFTYSMQFTQGFIVLIIALIFFLSPLGEARARSKAKCSSILDAQLKSKVDALYREAFEKAKISNPKLKDNIKLYMNEETSPNALAVGTKTICLTRGLLNRSHDEIVAVLTHELSHIVYKNTAVQSLMNAGDVCVRISFFLWKAFIMIILTPIIWIFSFWKPSKADNTPKKTIFVKTTVMNGRIYSDATIGYQTRDIANAAANRGLYAGFNILVRLLLSIRNLVANAPITIWRFVMLIFTRPATRAMEYDADEFTYHTGFGNGLCKFLKYIHDTYFKTKPSLMESISATHPDPEYRVNNLQSMGAKY